MLRRFKTIAFAILTMSLMGSGLALASTKAEATRSFSLQGKVVAVDLKERTMSIKEEGTGNEYVVVVPESSAFKIIFGKDSKRNMPTLDNVSVGDRVSCNVRFNSEQDQAAAKQDQVAKRSTKVTIKKS
jgi:hypothetical protein